MLSIHSTRGEIEEASNAVIQQIEQLSDLHHAINVIEPSDVSVVIVAQFERGSRMY